MSDRSKEQLKMTENVYELLVQEKRRRIALEEQLEALRAAAEGYIAERQADLIVGDDANMEMRGLIRLREALNPASESPFPRPKMVEIGADESSPAKRPDA